MVLTASQAKELGEAFVDASQRAIEEGKSNYVIYLSKTGQALCLPSDPYLHTYGYNIVAHVVGEE